MKEIKNLESAISLIKESLVNTKFIGGDKDAQFIITGSYSLYLQGITNFKPNDLDIIIVGLNKLDHHVLLAMQESLFKPQKRVMDYPLGCDTQYSLFMQGVHVDIFISNKKIDTIKLSNFRELSTLMSVVSAKKGMARMKDFQQLKTIAESIYKESDLHEAMRRTAPDVIINKTKE